MEELLERAKKFLGDNPYLNEVELQDGSLRVRVVRFAPYVTWSYRWNNPVSASPFWQPIP